MAVNCIGASVCKKLRAVQLFTVFFISVFAQLTDARCPIGAIQGARPNDCYIYNRQQLTWNAADAACRRQGGQLPSVVDHEAMLVLQGLPRLAGCSYLDQYWLDAKYDGRQWRWQDGTTWRYTNWANYQPMDGENLCLAMNGYFGLWSSYSCDSRRFYICKVPPKSSDTHCPQGTAQGLIAIDCFSYDGAQASWMNAAAYCQNNGGYLATITSSFQNSAFKQLPNLVCSDSTDGEKDYWLGGVYSERGWNGNADYPNQWLWNDGPRRMSYKNWAKGQPNNSPHQCLKFEPSSGNWLSDNCDSQQFYVCKFPPVELQPKPTRSPLPSVGTRCPYLFTYVKETNKCLHIEWRGLQWNDALLHCYSLGGVLASIHSKESSKGVWNWVSRTAFESALPEHQYYNGWIQIGLADSSHKAHWKWSDGTPLNWTNWDVGHPCCGFCSCAFFQQGFAFNGIWHGLSCDSDPNPHPSLCEAEPY